MKKWMKWGGLLLGLLMAVAMGYAIGAGAGADAPTAMQETVGAADRIGEFRLERQQLRQMQISQLNEIIHGQSADADIVAMAQRRQMEIMGWSEQELTLEGILGLRDFEEALVTVHTDSVNVMLRAESITKQQAAVILELVTRETGISGGNVKIIPIN